MFTPPTTGGLHAQWMAVWGRNAALMMIVMIMVGKLIVKSRRLELSSDLLIRREWLHRIFLWREIRGRESRSEWVRCESKLSLSYRSLRLWSWMFVGFLTYISRYLGVSSFFFLFSHSQLTHIIRHRFSSRKGNASTSRDSNSIKIQLPSCNHSRYNQKHFDAVQASPPTYN